MKIEEIDHIVKVFVSAETDAQIETAAKWMNKLSEQCTREDIVTAQQLTSKHVVNKYAHKNNVHTVARVFACCVRSLLEGYSETKMSHPLTGKIVCSI